MLTISLCSPPTKLISDEVLILYTLFKYSIIHFYHSLILFTDAILSQNILRLIMFLPGFLIEFVSVASFVSCSVVTSEPTNLNGKIL